VSAAPLISVTVPTRNSERTLERCLQSVRGQDVPAEIIVADDCSTDRSRSIADAFGAQVLTGPLPLLEARIRAAEAASTGVVVLLDSDQILRRGVLEGCLQMLDSNDALVLEEESSPSSSWISGLLAADKRLLHHLSDHHLTPGSGSLLPRVFKSWVLTRAFELIPKHVHSMVVVAQDHAIIWDAVAKVTTSVGMVPNAVVHEEVTTFRDVFRKYFRWGAELPLLFDAAPQYRELTTRGVRGRLHRGDAPIADYVSSMALLAMKTVPYSSGYLYGRFVRPRERTGARTDWRSSA
jgi:glycosyltransferase involved in cell wall biosynthesis